MAPDPSIDPTGALTLKAPRENIFARPRAASDSGDGRRQAGIFAPAAACAPSDQATAHVAPSSTNRHSLIGWPTRLVAVAGAVAAIAALATRPAPDTDTTPSRPRTKPSTTLQTGSHPVRRQPKPERARAAAKSVHRTRNLAAPERAVHRRPAPRTTSPPAVVRVAPPAPSSPQHATRLSAARQPRHLPKRVPAGAPPEFM